MWEAFIPALVPLAPLAFGALGLWIAFVRRRRRLQGWQEAAAACGLQAVDTSGLRPQLTAQAGTLGVAIETCGNKGRYTQIILRDPGLQNVRDVRIRREPLLRFGPEIEIGDSLFDSTFFIEGPKRQVLAVLDADTRRLLGSVNIEGRLELSAGTVRSENMSDEMVPYVLPLLLDLGRRLTQPLDILRRLAGNAHRDPEPGVRLQNLLLLVREYPREAVTLEALRTACADASPEIRLRAAKELGAEGRDTLLDLAESRADDAVSAEAVAALAGELPFERMRELLDLALDRSRLQTTRACLEAIGRSGDAAAVGVLEKVLESTSPEAAAAAAQALGATGSPAAEPPLLRALQGEPPNLRVAAAQALGRVGSAAAVLPLKEAAEGSWLDRELPRTARQAIAEIQSRLQGAAPGQLSLAATEAGQLSLAQEAGHLALAQAELPQLPHSPDEREQPARSGRERPAGRPV